MEKKIISVVVPVYNVEKYFNKFMDNLLNQTYKNLQIILVDDGSLDSSGTLCDKYAETDNRIKVIHKLNEGLGMARNTGLKYAIGEYVAFPDSDDYLDKLHFEKLFKMANSSEADMVFCLMNNIKNNKIISSETLDKIPNRLFKTKEEITNLLMAMIGAPSFERNFIFFNPSACRSIYRRDIFLKNKIKFESERKYVSEDVLFNIDYLVHCNKISFVDEALYYYRHDNESSLTKKYNEKRFFKSLDYYYEALRRLEQNGLLERGKLGINAGLLSIMRVCIKQEVAMTKKIGKNKVKSNILNIIENKQLQTVLKLDYIYQTKKQKLFNYFVRIKNINLIYYFTKLQIIIQNVVMGK